MLPETQMSGVHNLVMTNNSSICIALLFFISHVSVYICNLHILEYTQFYLHIAGLHSLGNGHNWGECERALASFPGLPCFFCSSVCVHRWKSARKTGKTCEHLSRE